MSINTFILKVASRCNLNCSYCYMYNMGDDTYLEQPKFMDPSIVQSFANRLKDYCYRENIKLVFIAFHGGEPLLASKSFYRETVEFINHTLQGVEVVYTLQTNGVLLDDSWCVLFNELNIQVGVSIDGPEAFHDIYRVYHNNKGSFRDVVKGIEKRNQYGKGGLISVVNLQVPPGDLYALLKSLKAYTANVLLPDSHYDHFTDGDDLTQENITPYGDWLISLFECWKSDSKSERPKIPFFENIIGILLGLEKGDELIGKRKNGVVCIESNGAIEVIDPLRVCGNGFTRNNLNVMESEIEDILSLPLFELYYNSHDALCEQCLQCPVQNICGGGYLVHRYSKQNGFNNPTIYCKDLMKLITYIQNDIIRSLPDNLLNELEIEMITYEEALVAIDNTQEIKSEDHSILLESFKQSTSYPFIELEIL